MKRMSKEELRATQIGILDFFANLCEENDINYFLTYGTLLGAIRHKGFIPWDDDIDVAMLREDYEKLILLYRTIKDCRYRFSCVENDRSCMYPFGKIIDEETVLYEAGKEGIKIGVYIDVFVYDNAPIDKVKRNKGFDKLDFYAHLRQYQLPMKKVAFSPKRLCVLIFKWLIKVFLPRQFFTRKIVYSAKKYRKEDSNLVCDFTEPFYNKRWIVDKSLFTDLIFVEFENKFYKAPRDYDKWLRIQYGDYMKIPSVEEQKAKQHNIQAYFKD